MHIKNKIDAKILKDNKKQTNQLTITVKIDTANKIGLASSIIVILGAMIGIGIFLKNCSVFRNNNGNPWGILSSWIIVICAICTSYSYGEFTNEGLGVWSNRYISEKYGKYIKLIYPIMYYSIIVFTITLFLFELILKVVPKFSANLIILNFWYLIAISIGVIIFLIDFNLLSEKISTKTITIFGIVKFLPIILSIICEIVAAK